MSDHKVQGVKELNYPKVAVVVPTYNEAENLPVLAERLSALDIPGLTLIVVDDGSPDGTGEVAKQLAAQYDGRVELVQRHRKEGLGPAYIAGFSHALDAGADVIVQMDADLSHQPEYIPQFIDALGESDVVIGSRYVSGGGVDEHWGIMRRLISSGGNWGIRTVTGVKVKDATGGFKAFRQSALRSIDFSQIRCAGFGFQAEINHTCERMGYIVTERPIIFIDRTMGKSKMSLGIMIEAMWKLLPLRWKSGS